MRIDNNGTMICRSDPETAAAGGINVKEPEDESLPRQSIKLDSEPWDDQRLAWLVQLTPRENEIFQLLREGYTLKESAKRLNIKYSTANTYMTGVYKKLHVNSRAMLIIRYHDVGTKLD